MKVVEWATIRADVLALAHMLNGTCRCGRPNGRTRISCCLFCRNGYSRHGRACAERMGIPR